MTTLTGELVEMRIAEMRKAAESARLLRCIGATRRSVATPYRRVRTGTGRMLVRYGFRLISGPSTADGSCKSAA